MSHLTEAAGRGTRRTLLAGVFVLVMVVAFTFVWIGGAGAEEGEPAAGTAPAVSNVRTGRADAIDAALGADTTSRDFVPMPGMSETFSFDGHASRPVLVLFQGSFSGTEDSSVRIRLLIDGVVQPPPGDGVDVHEEDGSVDIATNGFNFISARLAPGTHTATIEWRVGGPRPGEDKADVAGRSLIVLHK